MTRRCTSRPCVPLLLALGIFTLAGQAFGQAAPTQPGSAPSAATQQPDAAAIERGADVYYVRTLEKSAKSKTLDVDREQLATVRRVGASLIEAARKAKPESGTWSWAFHVETRDEPQAWGLPGGKVLVSTGLLDRYALTPPELAALLAHTLAHALGGETAGEIRREFARRGETVSPDPNRTALAVAELLPAVLATPHDTASERAADALGLELMASAAVDPRSAQDAWRKVAAAPASGASAFAALHPMSAERMAALEARMPEMVKAYETALRELPAAQQAPAKRPRPARKRPS